jgi:hypothetical protein
VTAGTTTEKGVSFARGPALALGTILLAVGLYSLYKQHATFPPFSNFPDGTAPIDGKVFGVFGANGWTGMLTAIGGGLLLFGAAQHLLAKTMSLIVGVALGAAAVIALISGDVLGLAAANHLTELAWGIAAAILLVNTLAPRRRRRTTTVADGAAVERQDTRVMPGRGPATERVAPGVEDTHVMHDRDGATERVADDGETRETHVMHDRDGATERVADDGETRETHVMHDRDGATERVADGDETRETHVMHDREPATERVASAHEDTRVVDTGVTHDHEGAPFSPDDQQTRVMGDRDSER